MQGDASAGAEIAGMMLGMEGVCADFKANTIRHSGRSWTKGRGEWQAVVIIHQRHHRPAQRFFAHIPVGDVREFVIGNVSSFGYRGDRPSGQSGTRGTY